MGKLLYFPIGVGVSLGYSDTRNTAFNGSVYYCVALTSVVKGSLHSSSVMNSNYNEDRNTCKNDKSQYPVDGHKISKGKNDHHRAYEKILGAVMGELTNLKKIRGKACHYLSRFIVIVILKG